MMNIVNKVSKGILPPKVFTEIIDLEEGDLRKVMEDMFLMTKMSIVPLFQFQIENMLRNILLHLDPEASVVSYYKICEKLIHSITINDKEELITCLQIPAKIRNSLHSNGIYKRMSPKEPEIAKYYLEGVEFKFENGKGINCAGSGHIYLSFDKTLDIVDGILDSPEVSSIKTEIKDQWAWENRGLLV
ncbi:MAG: hypothetical protein IPL27_01960 [Lewinellaceae bacterium]|nr:hypothetical protein [Lewinellaceae bacterium]